MGTAELDEQTGQLIIRSDFFFYGGSSSEILAGEVAADIATHWNEPQGIVTVRRKPYRVFFEIRGFHTPHLTPETVWYNVDPRNNYFRIEPQSMHHVSFVDGINCNTGYFKADNLVNHSTTAAHEYGHTIGLVHPRLLDIRGQGRPGIMYPRGTICDPAYQYDPAALPLAAGGTMNPYHRQVHPEDIGALKLPKLTWDHRGFAVLGDFSSLYHEKYTPGE